MKALLIIDMQNDFAPGGPLAVPEADLLIEPINALIKKFSLVIATQDWHPKEHMSFATQHAGKKPGELIELEGAEQILWPEHCVQNTLGAEFVPGLEIAEFNKIIRKGTNPLIDSYSAFFDNAHEQKTELDTFLHSREVQHLYICGVATEYCVLFSVLDAIALGYRVTLIIDACKGIELQQGDVARAIDQMEKKGAEIAFVEELLRFVAGGKDG